MKRVFLFLLLLFLILRVCLILHSSHVYSAEELKQVSLAIDVLRGKLSIPFWCYLDSPHSGGSIFVSLILIPFFIILGKSYFTIKIVALVFSAVISIFVFLLLKDHYKDNEILFPLTVFFIFSTPHYLQKNIFITGNTIELLFILFLFVWLINKIVINKTRVRFSYLLLGLVAGFGLWVQYIFAIFIIGFILFWFFNQRFSIMKTKIWQFLIGFILGFSPWIIYNLIYGFPSIYADVRIPRGLFIVSSNFYYRFKDIFLDFLPRSFHFLSVFNIEARIFAYFLYSLFIFSLLVVIFKKSKSDRARKLDYLIVTLFISGVIIYSLFPLPVGSETSIWGSLHHDSEFYILFFQPLMFLIIILAYVRINIKVFNIVLYLVLALFMLQFSLMLDFPVKKKYLHNFRDHYAYSNIYESGFNFAADFKIWHNVFVKLKDKKYLNNYIKGSAHCWKERISKIEDSKLPPELKKELSSMSKSDKDIFYYYFYNFLNVDDI